MALKIAYLTPALRREGRRQNVGDAVIHLGVRNLMRCALGPHEEILVDLAGEAAPIPGDADILVVCGTPQLADTAQEAVTMGRIRDAASAAVPVRLNLGVGAFYFDAFGLDRAAADAAFAERVRLCPMAPAYATNANFHLCTARDLAATAALRAVGVPAVPLPCPGFFAPLFQPRPLLRRPAPLISVLNGTASFWHRVPGDIHAVHEIWRRDHPDAVFLAHDEEDAEMLTDQGIPHLVFDTAEELMAVLAAHDRLVALRVHGAVPAWSLGLDVTLLGLDRRALLAEDFGAPIRILPVHAEADLARAAGLAFGARPLLDEAGRQAWLARHLELYVRNIRSAVEAVLGPQPLPELPGRPALPAAPALHAAPGRYQARLFDSQEASFAVPPDRLRSEYAVEADPAGLSLTTDGAARTLIYGPYVTIPAGRWQAEWRLTATPPDGAGPGRPALELSVMKGSPGERLAATPVIPPPPGPEQSAGVTIEFHNPRDTGMVETVLRSGEVPLPPGWRIRAEGLRFRRLD